MTFLPTIFLLALATAESGNNPKAVNPTSRAFTQYQILPMTWARFSDTPTADPDPQEVERVAHTFLREIMAHTPHLTAYECALRWKRGPHATHFTRSDRDFADRVQNLYDEYALKA